MTPQVKALEALRTIIKGAFHQGRHARESADLQADSALIDRANVLGLSVAEGSSLQQVLLLTEQQLSAEIVKASQQMSTVRRGRCSVDRT